MLEEFQEGLFYCVRSQVQEIKRNSNFFTKNLGTLQVDHITREGTSKGHNDKVLQNCV